ncbi:hypothetical protein F5148DRAFT_349313 [Russula earlei]|uniref:Uncharacterized protein n=1 Tax=Russula earlei TaxID=71964 RepID=A0ACC0U118_9AGAM|nr:hypothetical protein F5148DRAFT_349313 [Russula earlei]
MNQQYASSAHQSVHHPSEVDVPSPSPGQRVMAIDAILDVIFSFSTPRAIITLSKTCRSARPIAASYFRVAYKPENLLQQFLPDPAIARAFRSLQAETGLKVFGKAAYNFLARAEPTDTIMNLYVDGSHPSLVSDFLTHAGYDVEVREHEFVFFRTGEGEQVIREITLQVSPPDSFDLIDKARILSSEFTDVITFDGAYSLFPAQYDEELSRESATLAKPNLIHLKPMYRKLLRSR